MFIPRITMNATHNSTAISVHTKQLKYYQTLCSYVGTRSTVYKFDVLSCKLSHTVWLCRVAPQKRELDTRFTRPLPSIIFFIKAKGRGRLHTSGEVSIATISFIGNISGSVDGPKYK